MFVVIKNEREPVCRTCRSEAEVSDREGHWAHNSAKQELNEICKAHDVAAGDCGVESSPGIVAYDVSVGEAKV